MTDLQIVPTTFSAIIEATPDSPMWVSSAVVEPINDSLENDGDIIYNGNDETFAVPTLGKTRNTFRDIWESDQMLSGYPNATRMVCIDIGRIKESDREETLRKHLDKKTVDVWKSCKIKSKTAPQFNEQSAAIHIDCRDDDGHEYWFEMIVNAVY